MPKDQFKTRLEIAKKEFQEEILTAKEIILRQLEQLLS